MTPLRAKYIRDLVIRGRSKNTQKAYTRCVCDLARYYRRSPELISYEEVTGWLHHLIKERQLAASSIHIAVSAVRFLYAVTLGRERIDLVTSVPQMKRAIGPADDAVIAGLPTDRAARLRDHLAALGERLHHRHADGCRGEGKKIFASANTKSPHSHALSTGLQFS